MRVIAQWIYASLSTNNAAYAHAQDSDWMRYSLLEDFSYDFRTQQGEQQYN